LALTTGPSFFTGKLHSISILHPCHLLHKLTTRTHFAHSAFYFSEPSVWNSLNSYSVGSSPLAVFKSRPTTFLFRQTFYSELVHAHDCYCPPAPLKSLDTLALYTQTLHTFIRLVDSRKQKDRQKYNT